MGRKIANPTVNGKGCIPEPVLIEDTTLDTHATLKTKILITGKQLANKTLLMGNYLYSDGEVRKVMAFYEDGSIEIESPFTVDLAASPVEKVRSGYYFIVSVHNHDDLLTGTLNGDPCIPHVTYEFEQRKGLDPIPYDTNGGNWLVATTQQ